MEPQGIQNRAELAALLICPNRGLAQQFSATIPETKAFNLIADIKRYPTPQQLDQRLRQLRPDVVLLDLSADTETALGLIAAVAAFRPTIHLIGLDERNDANVIIRSLRAGATEFLCAPFDIESQTTVITRILRLRETEDKTTPERGKVLAFVGAKAGMGTTTVAINTAFALSQEGKRKVLLADLDLIGGTISFALRLNHSYSVLDALGIPRKLDTSAVDRARDAPRRHRRAARARPARAARPRRPPRARSHRVHAQLLPGCGDRSALRLRPHLAGDAGRGRPHLYRLQPRAALAAHDPQSHLDDGADGLYARSVFTAGQPHEPQAGAVARRTWRRFSISRSASCFPKTTGAAHRALTAGKPVANSCELGRMLEQFGGSIFGSGKDAKKKGMAALNLKALLSEG